VAVPEDFAVIRTRRLDLVLMSPGLMRALLAADWDKAGQLLGADLPSEWRGEDWQWLGQRPRQAEADPPVNPWLPRVLLLRGAAEGGGAEPVVVGEAGFHGPPDADGRAEFGYMVVSVHRRRGYAEEAVRALMSWASAEHGITRFRASISPDNIASLSLIRKLGFTRVGRQRHQRRGDELVFHLDEPTGKERHCGH
jgi:[ribosomal protein S5]-alanine N-acetyltransferase